MTVSDAVKSTTQGLFDVQQGALSVAGIDIADQSFPDPALNPDDGTEPQNGDTYTHGDYGYIYYTSQNGWSVAVLDYDKTEYGAILESVNGQPVTNMYGTFAGCTNLTTASVIPNSVTNMESTFEECSSLETVPAISNSVTDMYHTFFCCFSLTGDIEINATPTRYNQCLYGTQITSISGDCTIKDEILATVNE